MIGFTRPVSPASFPPQSHIPAFARLTYPPCCDPLPQQHRNQHPFRSHLLCSPLLLSRWYVPRLLACPDCVLGSPVLSLKLWLSPLWIRVNPLVPYETCDYNLRSLWVAHDRAPFSPSLATQLSSPSEWRTVRYELPHHSPLPCDLYFPPFSPSRYFIQQSVVFLLVNAIIPHRSCTPSAGVLCPPRETAFVVREQIYEQVRSIPLRPSTLTLASSP